MALSFDGLSLSLKGRKILDDISGSFQKGRVTAILGANGAGKSSLLSCLAALREADAGTIYADDCSISTMNGRARGRMIGLLPQRPDIHWNVDVKTILALGRLPYLGKWAADTGGDAAIAKAMEATNITDLADRQALQLSGGEQGRVLLARVLAGQPEYLLADEPLSSLDPAHQFDILAMLKNYAEQGNAVIIVLHDLTQAARFADDVIIMKDGAILAAGPSDKTLTKHNIAQAYGVEVQISTAEDGTPLLVPIGRVS